MTSRNLKGTWPQALVTFLAPIVGIFVFRWAFFEPFVIPSGSMIPTLLVHDHIVVNKTSYGLHIPFGEAWVAQWSHPHRGEIVVFKYPKNKDVFYVKRVVAIGGDEVSVENGQLRINGELIAQKPSSVRVYSGENDEDDFDYFIEKDHFVRYYRGRNESSEFHTVTVPKGHYFMMGDNRDQSSDSRFWGFVPEALIVGRASRIWLSCDKTLPSAPFLCDPQTIRWQRVFQAIR